MTGKESVIQAYWFAAGTRLPHGDGRKIVLGKSHSIRGEIDICRRGLHASRHPFDALFYATGPFLYRVECSGKITEEGDKLVCTRRKYVAKIDATELLRLFARRQALSVIHLWTAPPVVREYLETGNPELRDAAWAAARDAARAAAWAAAWAAARAAARDAAWAAARAAARDAARDAAWAAARDAARDAAGAAARDAARAAAWAAAGAAARDAAGAAAGAAARDAARKMFLEMVEEAFNAQTA